MGSPGTDYSNPWLKSILSRQWEGTGSTVKLYVRGYRPGGKNLCSKAFKWNLWAIFWTHLWRKASYESRKPHSLFYMDSGHLIDLTANLSVWLLIASGLHGYLDLVWIMKIIVIGWLCQIVTQRGQKHLRFICYLHNP